MYRGNNQPLETKCGHLGQLHVAFLEIFRCSTNSLFRDIHHQGFNGSQGAVDGTEDHLRWRPEIHALRHRFDKDAQVQHTARSEWVKATLPELTLGRSPHAARTCLPCPQTVNHSPQTSSESGFITLINGSARLISGRRFSRYSHHQSQPQQPNHRQMPAQSRHVAGPQSPTAC